MKRIVWALVLGATVLSGIQAQAEILVRRVAYNEGDKRFEGYLAYDSAVGGRRPGVLIIHEWWGRNEYTERRAREYAALGYTAFVLDMYGDGFTTGDPESAKQASAPFYQNRELFRSRAKLGLATLAGQPMVDSSRLAVLGYCFGGTAALELARSGANVEGTIVFHGGLANPHPAQAQHINGKVLVLTGAADPFVSASEVAQFKAEMDQAGVPLDVVAYPNAQHAFTNPEADLRHMQGVGYNKAADLDSFKRSAEFLAQVLR